MIQSSKLFGRSLLFATIIFSGLASLSKSYATIPNNSDPGTFIGPTFRAGITNPVGDATVYNITGEVAPKNYRAYGTLAWEFSCCSRLKFSADYLYQRIDYPFFPGNLDRWVNQASISGAYQYDFRNWTWLDLAPRYNTTAYFANASSKDVGTRIGAFTNSSGALFSYIDNRHLAGATAGGISEGISIHPWCGGRVGVDLNYDQARFNKHFFPGEYVAGFGGTLFLNQEIFDDIEIFASAAVRQPFNLYQASLAWFSYMDADTWTKISIDGEYTVGKASLPNTYNIGLSINFFLDPCCKKDKAIPVNFRNNFYRFATKPAVYLPQVLVIPDDDVTVFSVL